MTSCADFKIEATPEGANLVVSGQWSQGAASALRRKEADGLVLNYARGFAGQDLEFLEAWPLRRLEVLHRGITDLAPIARLGESLEVLSVQAAPVARLDLGAVPRIRCITGPWGLLGPALGQLDAVQEITTWGFAEDDLRPFGSHIELRRLVLKEAPHLTSLTGIDELTDLATLRVFLAHRLTDVSVISDLAGSLTQLQMEDCPRIDTIDDVEDLASLRFLGIAQCGDIQSLRPVRRLNKLEVFSAWGSTKVVDGDLSPLTELPRLREVRMQSRKSYEPSVAEIMAAISG